MTTRRTDRRDALVGVLAIALAGTLARLALLGERIAHWNEGRLGYDVLRYAATGVWEYRPVTHGPLLYHVDRFLFETLGATDFAMRLPVAVVGGLLPLAAWLYRDHLRDLDVVALAAVLAANPVLVYYSRFARNDVLVAAFAFTTLGLLVRTHATGDDRYLYAASAAGALAFASKPNALVYLAAWIVAGAVVLDQRWFVRAVESTPVFDVDRSHRLVAAVRERGTVEMLIIGLMNPFLLVFVGPFSPYVTGVVTGVVALIAGFALDDADRVGDRNAVWLFGGVLAAGIVLAELLGDSLAATDVQFAFLLAWTASAAGCVGILTAGTTVGARIRRWRGPAVLATVLFAAITLVLFAPRDPTGFGLWSALGDPTAYPKLVDVGLVAPLDDFAATWLGGHGNDYLNFAIPLILTLAVTAILSVVGGSLGFLADRYRNRTELVEFATVWAGVSLLLHPIAVVTNAPWHAVHVLVPLAIPTAVALAAVTRRLPRAIAERDVTVAGVTTIVLCLAIGVTLATATGAAFLHPQSQDNDLVQYGQPADDFREHLDAATAAIDANDGGPDVVYYGDYFDVDNASTTHQLPVGDIYNHTGDEWVKIGDNVGWYNRLPLPWYFGAAGASVDSAETKAALAPLADERPAVVVTRSEHANTLTPLLNGSYRRKTVNLTQQNVTTTIFVERQTDSVQTADTTPAASRTDDDRSPRVPVVDTSTARAIGLYGLPIGLPIGVVAVGATRTRSNRRD